VGLINSRLGALNQVLRYCGAPSQISDISSLTDGSFDTSLACTNRCCEAINDARPYCKNSTDQLLFNTVFDLIDLHQAKTCNPVFLCRPNDECFDADGLFNPKIGAINWALYSCGIPGLSIL